MSTKVINKSEVRNAIKLKGILGNAVASAIMGISGFNKINEIYSHIAGRTGVEFADKLIEYLNVTCDYKPQELEYLPKEEPFIVVSNHPFGGIDGILLLSILGKERPDLKILTNFLLSRIPELKDCFFPVNPFTDKPGIRSSIAGLKMAKEHLRDGGALALFPSGEVSSYGNKEHVVKDIDWQPSIIKLIKRAGVPVVPVYFHGGNSGFFHFLGKIHPMLRTVWLPRELANKKNRVISMRIGRPISQAELEEYSDEKKLGKYLWNRTYALETNMEMAAGNGTKTVEDYTVPMSGPVEKGLLEKEADSLEKNLLFETDSYVCYLADYKDIPNLMSEIGRCREEAFRAVGEGTNNPIDTDSFDSFYKHLILWHKEDKAVAGAYRLGFGREILDKYGLDGLYTHSLFRYKKDFVPYLEKTIELGRSFISLDYQKEAFPLMLLIKGLFYTVIKYENIRYLIGPVSMSSWYPLFYRSLMIYYLERKHRMDEFAGFIVPKMPFVPDYERVDPALLLENKMESIEKFDRFLCRLSNNEYRLPTLLKKYLKINARLLGYNVDPDFNYCVDGLIMLDLREVPKSEIDALSKEFIDKDRVYKRFEES